MEKSKKLEDSKDLGKFWGPQESEELEDSEGREELEKSDGSEESRQSDESEESNKLRKSEEFEDFDTS